MNLTEFLLARIAEDEATARKYPELGWAQDHWELGFAWDRDYSEPSDVSISPTRVLAECDAKRRIVNLHRSSQETRGVGRDIEGVWTPYCEFDLEAWPCDHARALATPYADHPDFDEAWRP